MKSKLTNPKANKEYYSQSDGNFMPIEQSLYSHKVLDRVAWVREWVHKLNSTKHLDVGCKDGYLCLTLQAEGVQCMGVDPSEDAIAVAKYKALKTNMGCEYQVGYAESLKCKNVYNTVSCLEVIEHVIEPTILLDILSMSGKYVFISTPDINGRHGKIDSDRNQEHIHLFSKKELEELVSRYGTIKESVIRDDAICILFKSDFNEND